jgi:hypothetical protein
MGVDKNSSPKRELGLYPKFTIKDFHTSLPRSHSHSGPTNPRNKPQTIPKRKYDSRSKGLSCPATTLANSPRAWGGQFADTGRTVRYPRADGPLNTTEQPTEHTETRTVHTWSSNGPRATGVARTVRLTRGLSDTPTRTVRQTPSDQKQLAKRIEAKTLKNTR